MCYIYYLYLPHAKQSKQKTEQLMHNAHGKKKCHPVIFNPACIAWNQPRNTNITTGSTEKVNSFAK